MSTLAKHVDTLGRALGAVIREQEGETFFGLEERIREQTKRLRDLRSEHEGDEAATRQLERVLQAELGDVSLRDAERLVRAFSCYFLLVNIAEEHARVARAQRADRKESLVQAFTELELEGHDAASVRRLVQSVDLGLTFTAHPTEMRRRTVRGHLDAVSSLIGGLESEGDGGEAGGEAEQRITAHIEALWGTPRLRDRKPEVHDEVNAGLAYLDVIASVLPDLERDLEKSFAEVFGEATPLSLPVSLHSWMGGDRDGNPNVTTAVTEETFLHHERLARRALAGELEESFARLSQSTEVSSAEEPFRVLVQQAHDALAKREDARIGPTLERLAAALAQAGQRRSLDWFARPLIVRHRVFGVHLASLDIREHSQVTGGAVAELLELAGIHGYAAASEDEKVRMLAKELESKRPLKPVGQPLSESLERVLGPLRVADEAMRRAGPNAFGRYIVSMSEDVSDLLEVLVLARDAGVSLIPVPLFETLGDLERSADVMKRALETPVYRAAVGDGIQEIMIGYSDSNKDAGIVAANWALHGAQERIAEVCRNLGVRHRFFHGRGTSIGRGGGPMARGMLGQPPGTVGEGIRLTEQGEALSDKYSHATVARRNLEQGLYGLFVAAGRKPITIDPRWRKAMEAASVASVSAYRALVEREDFVPFFEAVTPIGEIAKLRIASRPVRRPGPATLASLRAIPWVMAWTQCRANVPGWYGLAPALAAIGELGHDLAQSMYEEWSFFRSMIDNAQMALAKSEMAIFRTYRSLSTDDRLGALIEESFHRTAEAVTSLVSAPLLTKEPRLRRSIELRNPYIEPIHRLQVELLRKARSYGPDEALPQDLERALVLSLHGIAAGMRNTG